MVGSWKVEGGKTKIMYLLVGNTIRFASIVGRYTDSGQFPAPKVFVVNIVGHFFQIRHVSPDQHVS